MTPEQEKARQDITRLYDKMIECGWLTGHAWSEKSGEALQFTPAGLQSTLMIADLFSGISVESDQGLYMAFFGFVEKVAKRPPEPQ